MFFDPARISAVRQMIMAHDEAGRRAALAKLLPFQRKDFTDLFRIMAGLPVTIRLLDPPLHEFLPHTDAELEELAAQEPGPVPCQPVGQAEATVLAVATCPRAQVMVPARVPSAATSAGVLHAPAVPGGPAVWVAALAVVAVVAAVEVAEAAAKGNQSNDQSNPNKNKTERYECVETVDYSSAHLRLPVLRRAGGDTGRERGTGQERNGCGGGTAKAKGV